MQLTIEQIKTIIKAVEKIEKQKNNKELATILGVFLDLICKQTNIKSINSLKKILSLYDSYKEDDWFKRGLEHVLLHGSFPEDIRIREIIKGYPYPYPVIPNTSPYPYYQTWYNDAPYIGENFRVITNVEGKDPIPVLAPEFVLDVENFINDINKTEAYLK